MFYRQAIDSVKAAKTERTPFGRLASAVLPTRAQLWGMLGVLSCVVAAVVLQVL